MILFSGCFQDAFFSFFVIMFIVSLGVEFLMFIMFIVSLGV